jgi:hypothetical protein
MRYFSSSGNLQASSFPLVRRSRLRAEPREGPFFGDILLVTCVGRRVMGNQLKIKIEVVISGRCKVDIHVTKQTKFGYTTREVEAKTKGKFCPNSASQQAHGRIHNL